VKLRVTDRDTPLWWDETVRTTVVICVGRKQKYFSNQGWTPKSLICLPGNQPLHHFRYYGAQSGFCCAVTET